MNISSTIRNHARRRPDHQAIVWREGQVSFAEFDRMVDDCVRYLIEIGVAKSDIVGLSLRDGPVHMAFLFAVARMGAVILPIDRRWTLPEKERVSGHFAAKLTLVEDDDESIAAAKHFRVPQTFETVAKGEPQQVREVHERDLPVVISLSSGTTGRPRGPAITHENLYARFMVYYLSLTINEHDRFACTAPLYFGGGRALSMCALYAGATLVLLPPPVRPQALIEEMRYHRCTSGMVVPTLIRRLLEVAGDDGPCLPDLRSLISTGSVLFPEQRERALRNITPGLIDFYGSTEGGGVAVHTPYHPGEKRGSSGTIVFGTEIRIVDQDMRDMAQGEVGRICYRSPGSAKSFFNDPEASEKAFHKGWYFPGDLGYLDKDGFLYITGREKEVIIRGGVNIYPTEIETVLLSHPSITDAAVVDIPSAEFGEEVVAVVCVDAGVDLTSIRTYCQEQLAPYKIPRHFVAIEELPKTSVGKIDKRTLRRSLIADIVEE